MSINTHVAEMRQHVGYQTISPAAELAPMREPLPTGMRAVDELLDGGLLSGGTHCISGEPTSGATSLFYQAVASVQAQGIPVLYLDMARLLDPPKASAAGIDLGRLQLLSGSPLKQTLLLIGSLARRGLPGLVALDHPAPMLLAQLRASLRQSPLTLLALSPGPLVGMQVSLECQRQDWRVERGSAVGFISELRLTAHPYLPFRQVRACFNIPLEEAYTARW